jgi:bile acid:Na+ symporter, BASS family
MNAILDVGVVCVVVLMMGAVGMELEGRHFREVLRRKGMVVLLLAAQAVVLPALGFLLTRAMALPPDLSAGILLLAACPVGDIANVYTLLAQANVALSVTVNTLSILFSPVTMAGVFELYGFLLGEHFVFAVPTPTLLVRVLLMLVLPVLAGGSLRRFAPGFAETHAKAVHRASIAGIAFLLVYVMVTEWARVAAEWQQTVLVAAVFMGLALLVGLTFAHVLRLATEDSVVVGIGFAVRNVALASAVAITLLNRIEYAVFAVVYFLTEVPLLLGVVAVYRCCRTPGGAARGPVAEPPVTP